MMNFCSIKWTCSVNHLAWKQGEWIILIIRDFPHLGLIPGVRLFLSFSHHNLRLRGNTWFSVELFNLILGFRSLAQPVFLCARVSSFIGVLDHDWLQLTCYLRHLRYWSLGLWSKFRIDAIWIIYCNAFTIYTFISYHSWDTIPKLNKLNMRLWRRLPRQALSPILAGITKDTEENICFLSERYWDSIVSQGCGANATLNA